MTKTTGINKKAVVEARNKAEDGFKTTLVLKAEDSIFFETVRPSTGKSLRDEGLQAFANAPRSGFIPDFRKLASSKNSFELFHLLGECLQNLTPSQMRILSVIFNNLPMLKNKNLSFGQAMYVNLSAPTLNYVDCYFKVFVIGCESGHPDSNIYVCGDLDALNEDKGVLLSLTKKSLLTEDEFKVVLKDLTKKKQIKVPQEKREGFLLWEQPKRGQPHKGYDFGEVPTLDSVPSHWFDARTLSDLDPLGEEVENTESEDDVKKKKPARSPKGKTTVGKLLTNSKLPQLKKKPIKPGSKSSVKGFVV